MSLNKKWQSAQMSGSQSKTKTKHQRQPPPDAPWCLENISSCTNSVEWHTPKHLAMVPLDSPQIFCATVWLDRQSQAISKRSKHNEQMDQRWIGDLDKWSATVDWMALWQEQVRSATITQLWAACSSFVDKLIMKVIPISNPQPSYRQWKCLGSLKMIKPLSCFNNTVQWITAPQWWEYLVNVYLNQHMLPSLNGD